MTTFPISVTLIDITQRKHNEDKILADALRDPLTGVLNRRGFEKDGAAAVERPVQRIGFDQWRHDRHRLVPAERQPDVDTEAFVDRIPQLGLEADQVVEELTDLGHEANLPSSEVSSSE